MLLKAIPVIAVKGQNYNMGIGIWTMQSNYPLNEFYQP